MSASPSFFGNLRPDKLVWGAGDGKGGTEKRLSPLGDKIFTQTPSAGLLRTSIGAQRRFDLRTSVGGCQVVPATLRPNGTANAVLRKGTKAQRSATLGRMPVETLDWGLGGSGRAGGATGTCIGRSLIVAVAWRGLLMRGHVS